MKFGASCAKYVIKILAFFGSLACYFLLLGFWTYFENKYYRLILCLIFPGYSVLYVAFTLATVCGQEIGASLNRVFAMLGVGAYWGAAAVCWLHLTLEEKPSGNVYCLAAGAVAAFQALVLTVDFMFLLRGRQDASAAETSKTKTERVKVKSGPSLGATALNSAQASTAPTRVETIKPKVSSPNQSPRRSLASPQPGQQQLKL